MLENILTEGCLFFAFLTIFFLSLCAFSAVNQTASQFIISDKMTGMVMDVLNSENELATRGQQKSYYYEA